MTSFWTDGIIFGNDKERLFDEKLIGAHKTIAAILIIVMILLLLFAAVIKYAEEIVIFKKQLYYILQGHKDTAQTEQDASAIPEREYTGYE